MHSLEWREYLRQFLSSRHMSHRIFPQNALRARDLPGPKARNQTNPGHIKSFETITPPTSPPAPLPLLLSPRSPPLPTHLVEPRSGRILPIHTWIRPNHPAAAVVGHQDGGGNHQPILRPQRRRVPRTDAAATVRVTRRAGVVAAGAVNSALGAGPAGAGLAVTLDWVVSNCPGVGGDETVLPHCRHRF